MIEKPDPDKVAAALERACVDTARQYDDRKVLADQVNWLAEGNKLMRDALLTIRGRERCESEALWRLAEDALNRKSPAGAK